MTLRKSFLLLPLLLLSVIAWSQKKTAFISGKVLDENENPLANVTVTILGKNNGIASSDSGTFSLKVPADKALALVFTYTG